MSTETTGAGQYSGNIQKLLSDIENYGKFEYSGQTSYKDVLDRILGYGDFGYDKQAQLDAAMQKVTGPEGFTYDPANDPTWDSYKKIYSREGDRAAQNALVQASRATGGIPSSYAVTAAQQAQNYYNGKMADVLPTLRQNAYQEALSALSVLMGDRDTQYGTWQDGYKKLQSDLGVLQTDRDMEHGQWSDYLSVLQNALGNYQTQEQMEYQREQDDKSYKRQQSLDEYQKQQNAYSDLMTLITTTGYVPDAATLAAAGMSAEEAAAWKAYYDKANGITATGGTTSATDTGAAVALSGYTVPNGWTKQDVINFQSQNGLVADGIWGPATDAKYKEVNADGVADVANPEEVNADGVADVANPEEVTRIRRTIPEGTSKKEICGIIYDSALTDDEKVFLINSYGITEDEAKEWGYV